jgi:hypothetical protein
MQALFPFRKGLEGARIKQHCADSANRLSACSASDTLWQRPGLALTS